MAECKVKWFNEQKGFGYIKKDEGRDVFFDQAIQKTGLKTLIFGQRVIFDVVRGLKGFVTENIKVMQAFCKTNHPRTNFPSSLE